MIDPADVPTITPADRASQPVASTMPASTPACHAPPATPPAPSTSPTRVMRATRRGMRDAASCAEGGEDAVVVARDDVADGLDADDLDVEDLAPPPAFGQPTKT